MRGATAAPTLYLGAAAGWDVDGLIGDASVLAHLSFAESTESLLAEHLARPAARRALMHPAKDGVALCPVVDDRGSLQGVVWGVYDLLDEGDRMRDAQVLVRRLEDARAQARFPQLPRNKAATEGCDQAVRRLASGAVNPQQAMIEALDAGSRETVTIVRNRQVFSVEA